MAGIIHTDGDRRILWDMEVSGMDYQNTNWWKYIDDSLQDLMKQGFDLLEAERNRLKNPNEKPYHDYAYIVFPAAKAYEGFLKKAFLDLKLLNAREYFSDHFRIGRAMSPTLPKSYRSGWVFGRLAKYCGGDMLPMEMWEVWKRARNRTFHFFPQHRECINLEEAGILVRDIVEIMDKILVGCNISKAN
jgi:hypothetical protein